MLDTGSSMRNNGLEAPHQVGAEVYKQITVVKDSVLVQAGAVKSSVQQVVDGSMLALELFFRQKKQEKEQEEENQSKRKRNSKAKGKGNVKAKAKGKVKAKAKGKVKVKAQSKDA